MNLESSRDAPISRAPQGRTQAVLLQAIGFPNHRESREAVVALGWASLEAIALLAENDLESLESKESSPEKGLIAAMVVAIRSRDIAALRALAHEPFAFAEDLRTALIFFGNA